jgi:hypothetical protein
MHAMRGNPGNFIQAGKIIADVHPLTKTFEKCGLYEWDRIRHHATP